MRIRKQGKYLEIQTPAKVNFFLELLGRREDGFHQLETVISCVSLFDTLRFQPRTDDAIRIQLTQQCRQDLREEIPVDDRNLIYCAVKLVRDTCVDQTSRPIQHLGLDIDCVKRIPSAAGMGGASSNAAAALVAANQIWNCGLSKLQLEQLGAQLGSDIPFFLTGGTAICEGRGEKVSPVEAPANIWLTIAKPPIGLSTAEVFKNCRLTEKPISAKTIIAYLSNGQIKNFGKHIFNRLEPVAAELTDWIGRLKMFFSHIGCLGHQMTGSGSCYFGIFRSRFEATRAANCLSNRHPDAKIFTCKTLSPCRLSFE